jgi:hypothetical protein
MNIICNKPGCERRALYIIELVSDVYIPPFCKSAIRSVVGSVACEEHCGESITAPRALYPDGYAPRKP